MMFGIVMCPRCRWETWLPLNPHARMWICPICRFRGLVEWWRVTR